MDQKEVREIDLLEVFGQLGKKLWILMIGGIIGAIIIFTITWFFITPTYESTVSMYVNNKSQTTSSNYYSTTDIAAAKSLVDTYIVILQKRPTLEAVIEKCGLSYTYEELKEMVSAEAENATEIFAVTVTSTRPLEAQTIVNAIGEVLPEEIAKVVEGASVQVVEWGTFNPDQVAPSYFRNAIIGFLLGLVLAIALVLIKYFSDNKIHDDTFVEKIPGDYPLLAVIPDLMSKGSKKKGYGYGYGYGYEQSRAVKDGKNKDKVQGEAKMFCDNLSFHAAEAYKLLRTNVLYALTDKGEEAVVFGVTSSMKGEAKTTTAINLAYTFAVTGKKVLLIEADMRMPVTANRLHLKFSPGLSNVLGGFAGTKEVIQSSRIRNNWCIITAGTIPPNPAELLESKQMNKLMEMCKSPFDYIIVDLPPVNVVSDALAISPFLDGLVLVAREEYTDIPSLCSSVQKIEFSQGHLLGYVLTNSTSAEKTIYRGIGLNKTKS